MTLLNFHPSTLLSDSPLLHLPPVDSSIIDSSQTVVDYARLFYLLVPETIVVVTALLVLAADLLLLRKSILRTRFRAGALLACLGCAVAIIWIARSQIASSGLHENILDGMLLVNPLTQLVQIALLVLAMLAILISVDSTFTAHVGEYLLLLLFATVGMMFLVASQNLLVIFISLELLSLSLYVLTAFNKRSTNSAEAALKYFLFGGMSAAFLLFGMSLLYGLSGSTNLVRIASAMTNSAHRQSLDPLLIVAIVMTVAGLGFKVAAVPFHLWAPDAYEGAPAPSAAFIASSSKVASFFIFAQVMIVGFAGAEGSGAWAGHSAPHAPGWVPVIAVVAAASMVLGNLVAVVQISVRRLLAYSAIAHAGYMLLGILSHTNQSLAALLYYVLTYALTTLGAFGVVAVVEAHCGGAKLSNFAGLSRRAPTVSVCMMVFLLSLAGVPPLAGFFGKFFLFSAALSAGPRPLGLLWLVVLAVAMSAVSLYYYLQVLKRIFVAEPPAGTGPLQISALTQIVLCLVALSVVLLGCAPNLLLQWIRAAISNSGS